VADLSAISEHWLEVADRQTPTVRALMVIELSSPEHDVVVFASRAPGPGDDEFRHRLLYLILQELEIDKEPRDQLRHLHAPFFETDYLLSYWQRKIGQRQYLVVAWHDIARIVHEFLPSLYGTPNKQNRMNIVDAQGRIIFGLPLSDGEFTVGRQFQTTLYKWRLNVALNAAEQLADNTERRLQLEIVLAALSALVVIAGSAVILIAAGRERRLANLKSEFVANVSHELKTPLSLIRMFAELLQGGRVGDDDKRKRYLDIIVTESERLSALIENVLNFAKLERGGDAYEFAEVDLIEVARRVTSTTRVRAEREGIQLELTLGLERLIARVDERAIEIALTNLIDNALKYGAEGGWVGVEIAAPVAGRVNIVVRDIGPGIATEDRERIFQRFARGENKKRARGTGIGLALVKSIAEAHGGSVWVEENGARGAAFFLRLRVT
jgi:two-component system, OmpR family, phosphate regulon sensor histidine kinase PhoR